MTPSRFMILFRFTILLSLDSPAAHAHGAERFLDHEAKPDCES
jgi:hypothetical protein